MSHQIVADLWVSEDGSLIPQAKIRRIHRAQDALNTAEEAVYNLLWNQQKSSQDDGAKLAQVGYDQIMKRTKLSKKTVQRIIDKLIDKEFIAIEIPADIYHRTSTTYRVYSYRGILDRQAARGRLHVAKVGPGVVYAHRPTASNLTTVDILYGSTVVKLTTDTVARDRLTTVVSQTTSSIEHKEEHRGDPQTAAAFRDILTALRQYGPADDDAAQYILRLCRNNAPDATESEILHFLEEKGNIVLRQRDRIVNPIGFLLSTVPRCFVGETLRLYREETVRQREMERQRQTEADAEMAAIRRDQERILADPSSPAEDCRLARKILGLDPWTDDLGS